MPDTEPRATLDRGTFTYANPGTIIWGPRSVAERLDDVLGRLGSRRIFLVTTRSVAANPALAGALREQLGERLVGEYGAIGEHAPAASIAAAVAAARTAQPDGLISFGGGSPADAAKIVALALATDLPADPAALAEAGKVSLAGRAVLPVVAIPTTLSVAELASGAGYTAEGTREKTGVRAPELMPAAVLFDPTLTLLTPMALWLSTGIRAVDHAVEGILAPGSHPFSDTLALVGLGWLRAGLLASQADPADLSARTQCYQGAWFSFTSPAASAAGLSHTLGKRLGSRHGIPHGVTSCLLLPHVMRYLAPRTAPAQLRIAEALGVDVRGLTDEQAAARAADAVADLIAQLGLPRHLADYGLSDADLAAAVKPVATESHPAPDLVAILRAAR